MRKDYTRKDFLKTAGSTALFAALGITFAGCEITSVKDADGLEDPDAEPGEEFPDTGEAVAIQGKRIILNFNYDGISALAAAGGWMLITQGRILAVNIDGESIRAFTSVCTHADCADDWSFISNTFRCNCHMSRFNTSGKVVQGPATRDLEEFEVARQDNIIVITRS